MRIIAGNHKGRRIRIPKNLTVRPTTDRAKEALFSILNHKIDFESTHVLDLYSGTGSIGFEFCSRGCPSVTSVDANQACVLFVESIANDLDLPIRSIRMTAKNYLSKCVNDFDVIFADPPYDNGIEEFETIKAIIETRKLLRPNGSFIFEHKDKIYNRFYQNNEILVNDKLTRSLRLTISEEVSKIIKSSSDLLGFEVLEKM